MQIANTNWQIANCERKIAKQQIANMQRQENSKSQIDKMQNMQLAKLQKLQNCKLHIGKRAQYTLYSIPCKVDIIQYTVYSVQCKLYSVMGNSVTGQGQCNG